MGLFWRKVYTIHFPIQNSFFFSISLVVIIYFLFFVFVDVQRRDSNSHCRVKFAHQLFSGVTESLPLAMVKLSLPTRPQSEFAAMFSKGFSIIMVLMRKMHFHVARLCIWKVVQVEEMETLHLHQL